MTKLFTNLWAHRELCLSLTRREVSARYKQSLLGPAWAILQPLALLVVFTAVQRFIHIPSEGLPYPVFVYAGLVPWTFFAGTLAMMTPSIVQNASIVKKIYFPREVLPFSSALVGLVDLAVAMTTLLLLMAYYGVMPAASAVYLAAVILIELVFVTGVGLFTAAVCAFQRDILFVAVFVLQLWMFISPVLYPLSAVPPEWRTLYLANPMASIITLFRDAMFGMNPIDHTMLGVAAAASFGTLLLAYGFFKSVEKYFADSV